MNRRSARAAAVAATALLALGTAACSSSADSDRTAAAGKPAGQAGGSTSAVEVKTFQFGPKQLTVAPGTTVTWTNADAILHTVTSGTRTADAMGQPVDQKADGTFDLKLDGKGATGSHTFDKPGTYTYFCSLHPGMDATVVVR